MKELLCLIIFSIFATTVFAVRYQADICLSSHGSTREITQCGVFVQDAWWECPFGNNTFDPVVCAQHCTCLPGTGQTPVIGQQLCDGIDRACDRNDIDAFCGLGASSCTKRCQYLPSAPQNMGDCVVLNTTCTTTIPLVRSCTQSQLTACGPNAISCTQTFLGNTALNNPQCVCNMSDSATNFQSFQYTCDKWESYVMQPTGFCIGNCSAGWLLNNPNGCRARKWFAPWVFRDRDHDAIDFLLSIGVVQLDAPSFQISNVLSTVRNPITATSTFNYTFYTLRCDCDGGIMRGPVFLSSTGTSLWNAGVNLNIETPNTGIEEIVRVHTSTFKFPDYRVPASLWNTDSQDFTVYVGFVHAIDPFWQVQDCRGPFIRATPWKMTTFTSSVPTNLADQARVTTLLFDAPKGLAAPLPTTPLEDASASGVQSRSQDLYFYKVDNVPRDSQTGRLCSGVGIPKLASSGVYNEDGLSDPPLNQSPFTLFTTALAAFQNSPYSFWPAHFQNTGPSNSDPSTIIEGLTLGHWRGAMACQDVLALTTDVQFAVSADDCNKEVLLAQNVAPDEIPGFIADAAPAKAYYSNLFGAQKTISLGLTDCTTAFNMDSQLATDGGQINVCNAMIPYLLNIDIAYSKWAAEGEWFLAEAGRLSTAYSDQISGGVFSPRWSSRVPFTEYSGCDCLLGSSTTGPTSQCLSNMCCNQQTTDSQSAATCNSDGTGKEESYPFNPISLRTQPCKWLLAFAKHILDHVCNLQPTCPNCGGVTDCPAGFGGHSTSIPQLCPLLSGTTVAAYDFSLNCAYNQNSPMCTPDLQNKLLQSYCHWGMPRVVYTTDGTGVEIECTCDDGVQQDSAGRCTVVCPKNAPVKIVQCVGPSNNNLAQDDQSYCAAPGVFYQDGIDCSSVQNHACTPQCSGAEDSSFNEFQAFEKCNGHGYTNASGCVCDTGYGGDCCEITLLCDTTCSNYARHTVGCDTITNPSVPTWICLTTPEGNFTGACCDTFIWTSTNEPTCFNGGFTSENSLTIWNTGHTVSISSTTPHCQCPYQYTGPLCNIAVCQITSNGTCNGQGICDVDPATCSCGGNTPCLFGGTGSSCVATCRQSVNQAPYACIEPGSSGVFSGYDGCACNIHSGTQCRGGLYDFCSNAGTCLATPSVNLTDGCVCDNTHNGTYCENSVCGTFACNGLQTGGVCCDGVHFVAPSSNSPGCPTTPGTPYCSCQNTRRCNGFSPCAIFAGAQCDVPITCECGIIPGSQSAVCDPTHEVFNNVGIESQLTVCNGQGTCSRDSAGSAYFCHCANDWTGSFCQNQPCNFPTGCAGHSTCDHGSGECVCYKHWSPPGNVVNMCSTHDCGALAHPSDDSFTAVCVCNDPTKTFESGCTQGICPVDSNGVTCGTMAPWGFDPPSTNGVKIKLCPDSNGFNGLNCCFDGQCICSWQFRLNTSTGLCDSICDPEQTLAVNNQANWVPGTAKTFGSCSCHTNQGGNIQLYDPTSPSFCRNTICQNGGTINENTGICTCPDGVTGNTCNSNGCAHNGIYNSTSHSCTCSFPFAGTLCQTNVCQNGGTAFEFGCICPFAYGGPTCNISLCRPTIQSSTLIYGIPSSDGQSCICSSIYFSGPYCNISQCEHGAQYHAGCECGTQYLPPLCKHKVCGDLIGVYFPNNQTCDCQSNAIGESPITGECSASLCGPFGSLTPDLQACTCDSNTISHTHVATNVSILCIPECENGGFYEDSGIPGTFRPCQDCQNGAFGTLCQFLPPSSTGIASPKQSSTASAPTSTAGSAATTPPPASTTPFTQTTTGIAVIGGSVAVALAGAVVGILYAAGVIGGTAGATTAAATTAGVVTPLLSAAAGDTDDHSFQPLFYSSSSSSDPRTRYSDDFISNNTRSPPHP